MNAIRLSVLIAVSVVAIIISYVYLDRPFVHFFSAHDSRSMVIFHYFANTITQVIGVGIFVFSVVFAIRLLKKNTRPNDLPLFVVCMAVFMSQSFRTVLKAVFGRAWPDTFKHDNPSFLQDGVYGFHWFSNNDIYQSFPSGHAAFIAAFAICVALLYPRLRWFCALLMALVLTGQLVMYYHFLSDLIAGCLVGGFSALVCYGFYRSVETNE
ncbi:Uncharacterised protein [BD1-7 clade bacterium]|uniref:Phosphatidic acid phosphatase type 2/haloperoxidase domain-containing protein n=1 Tax=BD1-7 clade bacterium TaxID=2029982 RepID=A0A5S9PKK1_9GAMM|nr:Uncharacterised protein [BD1-7 clade bacterium]CAA0104542.1 Uncharacterised protein [BD1-7 clade bacterium]